MPALTTALVLIAGKALLKKLAKTLLEHWTECEWVADVIVDGAEKVGEKALERIYSEPKEKVAEAFDAIANAQPADLNAALDQAVAEAAPDQPAECQAALRANLSVAAQRMRQARTLAAPNAAGQPTIPPSLLPATPEELLRYLPILPPSGWRPGDTLYPGARQYTFVRLLGIGGFGEVWETRNANRPGDAHRAVKVFSHRDAAKYIAHEEANMRRVMDMMSTAPHPGIVPIIDQNLDRTPPSLAYELVEGQELTWLIRKWHAEREGPTPAEAARLLLRLAEIVAHCHAHGIIHRDLKPANILVDAPGRMHITDFGLSQATAAAEGQGEAARQRQSRLSLTALKGSGTVGYASPEQFDRNVPPDVRDDIHALGVIGYELLTNTLPRGGLSRAMSRNLVAGGVPEALVDALSDCLEQHRADRLGSTAELVKKLAELAGAELIGHTPGPSADLDKVLENLPAKQASKTNEPGPKPSDYHESLPPDKALRTNAVLIHPAASDLTTRLARGKPGKGTPESQIVVTLPGAVEMPLCYCPAGTFLMGSPADEAERCDNEKQVSVTLTQPFWMARTAVTQAQWESLMGNNSNPSHFKGADLPVESVNWHDAKVFIQKLNERVPFRGWHWALPTEAQWEYACRAGTRTPFHFGSVLNGEQANCDGNFPYGTTTKGPCLSGTSVVGSYPPNGWGLCDMHGNVWEWCEDEWDGKSTLRGGTDPVGRSGGDRVFRGGGWIDFGQDCRSARRDWRSPGYRYGDLGVRVDLIATRNDESTAVQAKRVNSGAVSSRRMERENGKNPVEKPGQKKERKLASPSLREDRLKKPKDQGQRQQRQSLTSCHGCKNRLPYGKLVCPRCGCLDRGAIGLLLVVAGGGNLAAYFCGPGIWRWLCNGLGAFFCGLQ